MDPPTPPTPKPVNLGGWMLKMLVVPLPCVESWSNSLCTPVVHIYKSHHQLSEHLQPPLPHQIDGEMEEKSMASSPERSNSVMFGSLMFPSPTLSPLWEIEILSLNKLTDVNRLESLKSICRPVSSCCSPAWGSQFSLLNWHVETAEKDPGDQVEFTRSQWALKQTCELFSRWPRE